MEEVYEWMIGRLLCAEDVIETSGSLGSLLLQLRASTKGFTLRRSWLALRLSRQPLKDKSRCDDL